MANNIAEFRRKLNDPLKYGEAYHSGDGSTRLWSLGKSSVNSAEVTINGTPTTAYQLDSINGTILFDVAPGEKTQIGIVFTYAGFTDAEINDMVSTYGFKKALVEAVEVLLINTAKLGNYKMGDSSIDTDSVFEKLKEMREIFKSKIVTGAIVARRSHPAYDKPKTRYYDLTREG